MTNRLEFMAAAVLGVVALIGGAGPASARGLNCYYVPEAFDCVDWRVDCECIVVMQPPHGYKTAGPDRVIDQSTLQQSIGW